MTVILVLVIALGILWGVGSKDFAMNMSIIIGCFGLLELISLIKDGETITTKFYEWSKTVKRWKVLLVASVIGLVGIYFTMHLAFKW